MSKSKVLPNFILPTIFLIISCQLPVAQSANILFLIGPASQSHRNWIQPLITKLAENGHKITVLSPLKPGPPNPNITEFCPQSVRDIQEMFSKSNGTGVVVARLRDRHFDEYLREFGTYLHGVFHMFNEATLESPQFQDWFSNYEARTKVELVFTEVPLKEIGYGLAHRLNAKVIGIAPLSLLLSTEVDTYGWSPETSWLSQTTDYALDTSRFPYKYFPDHFIREFNTLMWYWNYKWNYLPKVDSLLRKVFKDDNFPPLEELVKNNTSLLFINSHFSIEFGRSLPPFVIPVGGMVTKPAHLLELLPQAIEDFIQSKGSSGFVYISFGSFFRVSGLPGEELQVFFKVMANFTNVGFLLTWNEERPPDLPENVFTSKWFPQQSVLAHPKCLGFVSQGGMVSFQEAVYHNVPLVIIPIGTDQPYMARKAATLGNGIYLELADLTFDTLREAIGQILFNKSYTLKAQEISSKFRDRPMSPLDTAVWWTEYVLRQNDTSPGMKPLGIYQQWWQRRLLDFWAFVFVTILFTCFFILWTPRKLVLIFKMQLINQQSDGSIKIKSD